MIGKKIIRRIGSGLMAGICAFTMMGTSMSGVMTASAADTTVNAAFPSADKVVKQAATLLGCKYLFGAKGYSGVYKTAADLKALDESYIRNQGIDCSGLVYYTLTHLGYKTSGFSFQNPVPVDTAHWLSVGSSCKITYDGKTSVVDVEKKGLPTPEDKEAKKTYEYWENADGSTITPGSVVVAQNPYGEDHSWIYIGEFSSRSKVVEYLKEIGVPTSKITTKTVGDGKGDGGTHWRIEANSEDGVVINNNTDGKSATALNMYAFRITKRKVTFKITKKDKAGNLVGKSSVDGSTAQYAVYSDSACKKKVATITIGSKGTGSTTLDEGTYYIKETKAPKGYELDTKVYKTTGGNTTSTETRVNGSIKINKTADDGVLKGHEFKVSWKEEGKSNSMTVKTNANGTAEFSDLYVYDRLSGEAIKYTVSEINVDTRYVTPKAQNVYLTSGDKDFTVTTKFVNNSKTGSIKINKQAEDGDVGNRTFTVTGNGKTYTAKTNSNGIAEFSDLSVYDKDNKKITYTISEKGVPLRYVTPADQTATLTVDATTTKTFNNKLKKGSIKVNKQAEDNEVGNRKFAVTGNGKTYTQITSNTGIAEFKDLPIYDKDNNKITYTISEKDVPIKYAAPADQKTTLTVDATVEKTFVNKLTRTSVQIFKEADDDVIEGVKFKITGNGKTYNVTTDKDGYAELENIEAYDKDGKAVTYTVSETDVPLRYITPAEQTTTVTVNRASVVRFKNKKKTGNILVNKQAEDGVIGSRTFTVTGNGKTYSVKTNDKGIAEFKDLPVYDVNDNAITYTISEKNVPVRYATPADQKTTLTVDATVSKTFENKVKKGNILVNKQADDGQIGGRTFAVTGNGKTYTAKTNVKGIAEFKDLPVYDVNDKAITYTISEKDVPVRYVVPADQTATLTADATVSKTFTNNTKKGNILINKQAEDGEVGDRTFEVTGNGKSYTAVTNTKGVAEFKDLPVYDINDKAITYTISEKNVPVRYVVPASQKTTLTADATVNKMFDNKFKKGYISIIKHSDMDENTVENLEKGAEFEVYSKDYESYDNAPENKRDCLTTDEKGFAKTKALAYGTYIVHQTKTVNDAEYAADFEVQVTENEKTYEYVINNAPYQAFVKVTKVDSETGKAIALSGAGFEIYRADKTKVVMTANGKEYSTFYTDSNGIVMTPSTLGYGRYTLVEVQAPEGYVLDSTPAAFEVTRANSTTENAVNVVLLTKQDTPQKGTVTVEKTGELFIGFDKDPETAPLSGAEFEVRAAEDVITPDGTKRACKGDVVATIVTDSKGIAKTEPLYLGKYTVLETKAPYGYVRNEKIEAVEIKYAGQNVSVNDEAKTEFFNEYQRVSITLRKYMEHDELFGIGGNDEYKAVRFGLYTDEEIKTADGNTVPKDYLVSELSLSEDHTASFDKLIPFGKYYVQEIATDEHYVISGEKYLVTYSYAGQDIPTVIIDCGRFDNTIKRGSVKGLKVNSSDEPLENALFGLFKADETEFTAENALMTSVSDENGSFGFEGVAYGKYVVKEIAAPDGYKLSDKKYDVTISENGQVIEIKAENKPINVSISKQDVYGKELPGASMQLLDADGKTVDEWVSTNDSHLVTTLKAGSYTLKETASPDGYVIATSIEISIDNYGRVTVNGIKASATDKNGNPLVVMVDDTTKVMITKTNITGDKEIEGAKMQIVDDGGNVVEEWTSSDKPHFIEGKLTAGKRYTLHEESAPDGYVVAADIQFTVSDGGIIDAVLMKDDTTKVKVSKRDVTNDKELAGAKLQIIDSNGKVVEEWVSTDKPHYIEGKLIAGGEYTLREITAPDGYEIANDVKFKVNEDGSVTEVTMYDTPVKTPEKTETPKTPYSPKTGDDSMNNMPFVIAVSALGVVLMLAAKKRNRD